MTLILWPLLNDPESRCALFVVVAVGGPLVAGNVGNVGNLATTLQKGCGRRRPRRSRVLGVPVKAGGNNRPNVYNLEERHRDKLHCG